MKRLIFFLILVISADCLFGQLNTGLYDTDLLPASFHKGRREALRMQMPENSIAVFLAHPVQIRSNDVDYEFHQNPDFYYLTGHNEPNSLLIITKEKIRVGEIESNEFLFVQDRNEKAEVWTGRRAGIQGSRIASGIEHVYLNSDFENFQVEFARFAEIISVEPDQLPVVHNPSKGDYHDLLNQYRLKTEKVRHKISGRSYTKIMAGLREIKTPEELVLLQKAIDITGEAHIEVMKALKEEMTEYEIEALLEYTFKKRGSEEPGFPSIVGAGENSCILHYVSNRRKLEGSNTLVIDIGAEYHGYTADITRTLPVDGTFSPEEAAIYQVVLKAQQAGIEACKPGNLFWDPHQEATKVIKKGLLDLGIIKNESEHKRYFMHGTSHYLGLDVHDAGNYGPLQAGTVITVEPGIYIPAGSDCDPKWWNIGVRIEDDVLITSDGYKVLSLLAPRAMDEVEKMMAEQP